MSRFIIPAFALLSSLFALSIPSTPPPMRTPSAAEIADGYLTVAADPDSGSAPLTVLIVASYIGPVGIGSCGGAGPDINTYEFGDGTQYLVPAPGCTTALRTPVPTPTAPVRWTYNGMRHSYIQPGTYHVRVSGGTVNDHGVSAETTVVVGEHVVSPPASGGSIDIRILILVLAGGGVALLALVALAFVIATR